MYTTVYPGVEKFLQPWAQSVRAQTDRRFDLWVGVDRLDTDALGRMLGEEPRAHWVQADPGASPARIRQKAMENMIQNYDAMVFVDSDDLLEPTRVAAARASLEYCDVSGCAMRIIDETGKDEDMIFLPPQGQGIETWLPRSNAFGLSNTVYRSDVLRRCLPVPAECVMMDWLLATRAWAAGARMGFDETPRMRYRQYSANVARVLPPFTDHDVLTAASQMLNHYDYVLTGSPEIRTPYRQALESASAHVDAFHRAMTASPQTLDRYVQAVNRLPAPHLWWAWVAHPQLEELWSQN